MKVVKDGEKMEKEASENLFFIDTNGSDRLRQRVFDDELGEPIPKEEKRKIRELKKKLEKNGGVLNEKKAPKKSSLIATRDLWADEQPPKLDSKSFLKPSDLEVSKKSKQAPYIVAKPNEYPSVPIPKPGLSYNPDREQHQDVLGEALAKEVAYEDYITEEKKLPAGLTKSEVLDVQIPTDILASSLLFDEEDDHKAASSDGDDDAIYLGPTTDKKIPASKRRKQFEHEEARRQAERRRSEKRLLQQADQSRKIARELEEEEKRRVEEKRQRDELRELKAKQEVPAIIRGGVAVKEVPQAELLFSDEITGNLRTMKNVTSSVKDRMESIDRRHLVQMGGAKMKEKFRKLRIKKGVYQNPLDRKSVV